MITRLARDIRDRPSRWVLALLFLFMFFPGADLATSGLFYVPGTGFTWDRDGFLEFVRGAVPVIIIGTFLFSLILWVAGLWNEQWFIGVTTSRAMFLVLTLLVGPGLLVESLLKPNWGRARPKDITLFGGEQAFTPPLWIANECEKNCSFVSGHAAVAFWVTAYAFFLPAKWRTVGVIGGALFGFGVGFVRIAQGAHFLSDVIFAGIIVIAVNYTLARWILDRAPREAPQLKPQQSP
jgi:lipid A 4'-phosphatase